MRSLYFVLCGLCVMTPLTEGFVLSALLGALGVSHLKWGKMKHDITTHAKSDGRKVRELKVVKRWLGHGVLSFIMSIFSKILTGQATRHWWVEIKVDSDCGATAKAENRVKRGIWYGADQSENDGIQLVGPYFKNDTMRQRSSGVNGKTSKKWSFGDSCNPKRVTVDDIRSWMLSQDSGYNVLFQNCQHFATNLMHEFC